MNKLKAFTLVEIMVTLILSGTVIFIAGSSYFIVNQQFINFRQVNQATNEVNQISYVLERYKRE